MSAMQEIEIKRYRKRIVNDVSHLVERYREIMAWDVSENNPVGADKLIFKAVHEALNEIETNQ